MIRSLSKGLQNLRNKFRRSIGVTLFDKPLNGTDVSQIKKILLIRWDAKYGDSFVSSFFFREIKKHRPDITIEVIIPEHMTNLYQEYFHVDMIHYCKKRPSYKQLASLSSNIQDVDLVIHLPKKLSLKDLYFIKKLSPSFFAGQDDELRSCNIKIGKHTQDKHFSDKFIAILNILNIMDINKQYIIPYNPSLSKEIDNIWAKNDKVITINPFGSSDKRCLNIHSARIIVENISQKAPDFKIAFIADKAHYKTLMEWKNKFINKNIIYIKPRKDIQFVIEALRKSYGLISVDTSIVHIANGLNKPLIAIYSADDENYQEWNPGFELSKSIFSSSLDDINDFPEKEIKEYIKELCL